VVDPGSGRRAGPLDALQWKLNRFRTMSPAEVLFRIRTALKNKAERLTATTAFNVPPPREGNGIRWIERKPPTLDDAQCVLSAARRLLNGRFDVFSMHGTDLGFPPNWLRDPRTGTLSPLSFGKTLDYRDESRVGDIKYLWEPSRHLELVTLAQAHLLSSDAAYVRGVRILLDSWFEQCPYPMGVHWTSSLEHAVRLVNWSVTWQMLEGSDIFSGEDGAGFRQRWLDSIYLHQRFIAGHFSRHSSANNHLFGEYMGLYIASLSWPFWPESENWRSVAQQGLEREARLQNAPDGVNREQGIWYHHEVADMMLLTSLAGRSANLPFSAEYLTRLEAMVAFIAAVMDVSGNVPMIGDSDDAVMLRLSPSLDFNVYRSLLATGAVLFDRTDFAAKAGRFDDKSRWLLGSAAADRFDALVENTSAVRGEQISFPTAFPDGGYWILGNRLGSENEIRVVADAGPLGYLSIAAHGHADALSFTLSVAGRPMLIDPGTYAYHTQRVWRDYFKGTSAHNTVRVDGMDQSVSGGNFMWIRRAEAHCEVFESDSTHDRFVGTHDGYLRLSDPVTHRRELVVNKTADVVSVVDQLECNAPHEVEIHWHFAEDCLVTIEGNVVVATNRGVELRMHVEGADFQLRCVTGQTNPPMGWTSRRFDVKVPSTTACWYGRIAAATHWQTTIAVRTDR
jgi:hypothetical protein